MAGPTPSEQNAPRRAASAGGPDDHGSWTHRNELAEAEMTLGDHLEELRRRVILALVGVVPILVLALVFGQAILALLIEPLRDELRDANQPSGLLATNPLETFAVYIQISLIATVLVGSPWLLYQLWKFVAPGLYAGERKFVHILVPLSTVLTLTSAAVPLLRRPARHPRVLHLLRHPARAVATPIVERRPASCCPRPPSSTATRPTPEPGQIVDQHRHHAAARRSDQRREIAVVGAELVAGAGITQQYRVSEYVKTVLNLALAFGVGFQTPVVVLLLGWAGIVDARLARPYRRYAFAICVVAGAVLTPADPLSMMLLAVPLYLLFELGMLLLIVFPPVGVGPLAPRDNDTPAEREPDGDADEDAGAASPPAPPWTRPPIPSTKIPQAPSTPMPPAPDQHDLPTDTDAAMMGRALALAAAAAEQGEVPVGAVVYETASGRVLAEAANRRECDNDPSAHAEFLAIREACRANDDWRLNHCSLAVTLEPCPMCAGLIVNARVGRLVYGADDPKAGAVRTLYGICSDDRLNHACAVLPGVMARESAELLRAFFRTLRGRPGSTGG
jgi:tRNA(adenine34) deaminase